MKKKCFYYLNSFLYDYFVFLQDFDPVAVSAADFGKFYKGDSYIVLKVSRFISFYNTLPREIDDPNQPFGMSLREL